MSIKNRKEFNWITNQILQHTDFLNGKDKELGELYRMCDNSNQIDLISDLLNRFDYVSLPRYLTLLKDMALHIKNLNYPANKIAMLSMVIDENADSSQAVLQDIKVLVNSEFDSRIKECNRFEKESIERRYNAGCRHFIAIDEFIGTGSTVVERHDRFQKMKFKGSTLDFCILSGMQAAVDYVRSKGINIHIINPLKKGISDWYDEEEKTHRQSDMLKLEDKLAERIGSTKLAVNSFGFRESESLYYKELGNIPNNVFPIFWWKKYRDGKKRSPLFIRVQDGY